MREIMKKRVTRKNKECIRRFEVTINGKRRGGQEILIPLQSRRN